MRNLHAVLAALATFFVLLVIGANRDCAPKYFQRGDVLLGLGLAAAYAAILLWSSLADDDRRRGIGALGSAGLATLFISTASIPVLAAPLAIVGVLRLPRSGATRWRVAGLVPVVVLATVGLLYLGVTSLTPEQTRCP